jgi:hypothetical protein
MKLALLAVRATLPLSLMVSALTACGAPQNPQAAALAALPPYKGRDTELFNDSIEPAALGMAMDRPHFRGNQEFRERAQAAGFVGMAKITTVTVDKVEDRSTYHLRLTRVGAPFAGSDTSTTVDIDVRPHSAAYGLIHQVQTRAQGKTVTAMWKRYREGEEAVVHYYLAPDDAETVAAAKEAIALHEVAHP